jgi:hypothetical protein
MAKGTVFRMPDNPVGLAIAAVALAIGVRFAESLRAAKTLAPELDTAQIAEDYNILSPEAIFPYL